MPQFNFIPLADDDAFDPAYLGEPTPFTQHRIYALWQTPIGRRTRRYRIEDGTGPESRAIGSLLMVRFPLTQSQGYYYAPYGPLWDPEYFSGSRAPRLETMLSELAAFLKADLAAETDIAFIRLDPHPQLAAAVLPGGFVRAPLSSIYSAAVQPRTEWLLDLSQTEEQLFDAMHAKTRYSVRQGEKRGCQAEIVTGDFMDYFGDFMRLMNETSERDSFHLHSEEYYRGVFASLEKAPGSFLSVARFEGEILVIHVIVVTGKSAYYVFGCSSAKERPRQPTYLSQWLSIVHAKRQGILTYNFGGITTEEIPYPGWDGLTRYKTRYGGFPLAHGHLLDLVLKKKYYQAFRLRKTLKKVLKRG